MLLLLTCCTCCAAFTPHPFPAARQFSIQHKSAARPFPRLQSTKDRSSNRQPSAPPQSNTSVPPEQQPANEYIDLINSPFFDWCLSTPLLTRNLGFLYIVTFAVICYPISALTFDLPSQLPQRVLSANLGDVTFILAFVLRLYSGWSYVGVRLKKDRVDYEETGWFDGGVEEKGKMTKARDQMIYSNDVKPNFERIKQASFVALLSWSLSACLFGVSLSKGDKMFDEYSPAIIANLSANDDLSRVAAEQSRGRPTYCKSRYYKALANGGQGC